MSLRSRLRANLTYANVVSTICLFVVLSGTAYAAATVTGKNVRNGSLSGLDLKNNSVRSADVRGLRSADVADGALLGRDFRAGELPAGPQGPRGERGDAGPPGAAGERGDPGSAVAYAYVRSDGTFDPARSKNIAFTEYVSVGMSDEGRYCVDASVPTRHAVATLDLVPGEIGVTTQADCDGTTVDAYVRTRNSDGFGIQRPFYIVFN